MKDLMRTRVVVSGDTVEIFEYSHGIPVGRNRSYKIERKPPEERDGKRRDNLLRARQAVRRIAWCNSSGKNYVKLLTLTYAITILDSKKVKVDIQHFVQQMRRYGYPMNYLYVLEHQTERGLKEGNAGCLHIHMFIFDDVKIKLSDLERAWKLGSNNIRVIRGINNTGAYICKYITKESYAEFGSHVYGVSRGLKRSSEERFFEEGYTDHLLDGVQTRHILQGVDVRYFRKFRHDYHDEQGVARFLIVKYHQGKWKDENLLEKYKSEDGGFFDAGIPTDYDSSILDAIYEQFRNAVEAETG